MRSEDQVLIADIGGTNARLGIYENGETKYYRACSVTDFSSVAHLVGSYLDECADRFAPVHAVLAMAGPVVEQRVRLTNLPWETSASQLVDSFDFKSVKLLNDFEAVAWGISALGASDLVAVGSGKPVARGVKGILGPGTGVGCSVVVPSDQGDIVLNTEGGHASVPALTELEHTVFARLEEEKGPVSIEDVLCGQGFVRLYKAICEIHAVRPLSMTPAEITASAWSRENEHCKSAVDLYFSILGTVTRNFALTIGAQGGIYLAGGILPRMVEEIARSGFRQRFEGEGPFQAYLAQIPTSVIVHSDPGLHGLATYISRHPGLV